MAEVLASLKKIGGNGEQYTETVLWTNPDPTSNFTGQNVTLSDSIGNYKYIKFTWKTTTSDTSSSSAYVLSSDLASMTNSNGSRFLSLSSLWTNVYSRNITYNSATSVSIATSTRQGASGSNNGVNIPLEILGVNELAHGTIYEHYATGYFTNTVRSVDLGFVPKYVFCANGGSASGSNNSNIIIYDANVSTTQFKFIANGTEEMRNIGTIGSTVQFSMEGTVIGMSPNTTITNFVNSHRQYVAIGYDNQ